ncbi:MAG: carboxypeptidase regulatory-like domain-containing protein, partial [Thermoplasmata archaeon]
MADQDEITLEDEAPKEQIRNGRFRMRRKKASVDEELKEPKRRRSSRSRKAKKLTKKDFEAEERVISQGRLWLSQNWKMMFALFLIFMFGLFLRSYFYYPPATENGFILSGNDPYYHKRVVDYVQENHRHLIFDPLLSYPDGSLNPRPPMFDWSVAILGIFLAPLFGGNVGISTWQVMEFSPAFWGAITIIPVYLIGKEMFNKKAGLICAFLLATMPSHVERSPLGFSDHDAMVLFFVVFSFFFFIKALNSLVVRDKWVINWLHPRDIPKGLKEWFKYNQLSVAFSLLSGLSLASIALIWKGFLYPVVIIIVYFFIQLILNKLRNKDSLGISLCTIITLAVIAFLPIPYYTGNRMPYVIEPAMEIFIAVIIISAVLVPTRDSPWLLVFSMLAVVLICGLILLIYVFPDIGSTYFSGQGYFVKTKIFSTIAEAQAPDYSRAVFSYGVVTTFLALYAILISMIRVVKDLKGHYLFMTIWGITAVYMAVSATRFIFNAGPIFAILSGWMVYELIKKLDFRKMRKHYSSLKGGGRFYAMKKSVKIRHIVGVLFLIFMILIPNIWLGWDAGVPFGEKKAVDVAVYDALPWFMKPKEYNADEAGNTSLYPDGVGIMYNRTNMNELKYFGAFGHGFPSDYWLDGMRWLSEQDQDLPIEKRPAFISWWDYGFWAIYLGEHPTAADNFQGRVQYAGSFISAQNESQAVSLLITRILEADRADYRYKDGHDEFKLHDEVRNILVRYLGQEKTAEIEDVLINPPKYKDEILNNPGKYGYYSSDLAVDFTPIYAILQTWIPELLTDDERVWLLHELQDETGYSLRYFAIDSRLFPFGPGNTGIFYAPLKLSDHRIDDNNEPYDYIQTLIIGSDGREYTVEDFIKAQENNPNLELREYKLKYLEPFLESMLLKCYLGYTLQDIGASDPGQGGTEPNLPTVHASNYIPMPGWMMKHFQLVYRTAYWNPYNQTEYRFHPEAWEAMSEKDANDLVEKLESDGIDNDKNGKMDADDRGEGGVVTSGVKSGVVFIKYYEGAYVNGSINTTKGTPVPNVRVTVLDDYGIPHDSTFTDENGEYHLIAPAGNVSIEVSMGGFAEGEFAAYSVLSQVEQNRLNNTNIDISDDQVMRRKIDEDGDGIWDYNIVQDFDIESNELEGRVFWDNNDDPEYNEDSDLNISLAKVIVSNPSLDMEYSANTDENGSYIFDDLTPGTYDFKVEMQDHVIPIEGTLEFTIGEEQNRDIGIKPGYLYGNIKSISGDNLIGEEIRLLDKTNETTSIFYLDSDGNYSYSSLLPGNYTIYVDIDGFESHSEEFLMDEGNTTYKNITLSPSTDVIGRTYDAVVGNAIGNVTIRFDGQGKNEGITKFARTNETGFYNIDLKNGLYHIRVKHESGEENPYVYLGEINAQGGIVSHDIPMQRGVEVFGTLFRDFNNNGTIESGEIKPYAQVSFKNSNGEITTTSNSTGFYRAYLPLGNYTIYATYKATRDTFLGKLNVLQIDRLKQNIKLEIGLTFEGSVYNDVNKNDIRDGSEGLAYATLVLTDDSGAEVRTFADSVGNYSLNLEYGKNFSVVAKQYGFRDFNLISMNISEMATQSDFKMIPLEITVFGITRYQGSRIGNVSISFNAVKGTGSENASNVSQPDGKYYVDLMPGEYRIVIDYNTTE